MKDLYIKGECGQGYEKNECSDCKWCMGKDLGVLACGKGLLDSKSKMMLLGLK